MKTAQIFKAVGNPDAVAICRQVPDSYHGKVFRALAPTWDMFKMSDAEFVEAFQQRILDKLDPKAVFEKLGEDAILLCWEGFNVKCHRRLVAEWFEKALGIEIPELGHERSESLPYDQMPTKEQAKQMKEQAEKSVEPKPKRKTAALIIQGTLF